MSHSLLTASYNSDDEDDETFFIHADDIDADIDQIEKHWTCLSGDAGIEMKRTLLPQQLRPNKILKTKTPEEDYDDIENDPESILPVVNVHPDLLSADSTTESLIQSEDKRILVQQQLLLHSPAEIKLNQYQRQYKSKMKKKREQEKSKPKIHAFNNLQYRTEDQARVNPPGLTSCSLVSFPGKRRLCLFGGMSDSGTLNDTWIYELGLQEWHKIEFEAPAQVHNSSLSNLAVTSANKTFANDNNAFSPLSFNNYDSHTKSVVPPKRCGHVAVAMNSNEMHVFGGQNVERMAYYNDMWLFKNDPAPMWKMLIPNGTPPTPRWYCSGVNFQDRFLIYGGEGENYSILKDIAVYSTSSNLWLNFRTIYPYPAPRMLHTACMAQEKMIVIGGVGKDDDGVCDAWSFDVRRMSWSKVGTKNPSCSPFLNKSGQLKSLYGHACCVWGNRVILYGGRHDNQLQKSVWMLDLISDTWIDISKEWDNGSEFPSQRWKMACVTDHHSHLASKTYRQEERSELQQMMSSQHQMLKQSNQSHVDIRNLQQTADYLLQKKTKTYLFGGMSHSRRYSDLWQFELTTKTNVNFEKW
jgi:hypothetical protein